MKENIKLGLILFVITAVAGLLLGMVHDITKEPIARQEIMAATAVDEVLPSASDVKKANLNLASAANIKEVYEGYSSGKPVGYIIKVNTKGFHGPIDLIVGISTDGKIQGIKILSHSETPGLGANIEKEKFTSEFVGKDISSPIEVVKNNSANGNQVDAVSGATISSKAVAAGVNSAIEFYKAELNGKGGQGK